MLQRAQTRLIGPLIEGTVSGWKSNGESRFNQPEPHRSRGVALRSGIQVVKMRWTHDRLAMRLWTALLFAVLATISARAEEKTPVGVWLHANERIRVEIFPCGDRLCGKIVWFKWPNDAHGLPLVDLKNEDQALRSRPLLGLTVIRNLRRTGENEWTGGELYNPDDGQEYGVQVSIQNDSTLRVRAYLLLPELGETLIWSRVR
jgi:uncharacterized protein (DUF2147 family)